MLFDIERISHIAGIVAGACVALWVLSFLNSRFLSSIIKGGTPQKDRRVKTIKNVILNSGYVAIGGMALIMLLREFSVDPSPILASAGIAGLAVSLGAQTLIKDILAGSIVLAENQYSEGDFVKLDEITGTVECLTLRKSVIRDTQGSLHHVAHGSVKIVSVLTSPE